MSHHGSVSVYRFNIIGLSILVLHSHVHLRPSAQGYGSLCMLLAGMEKVRLTF